jgi:hypothetical protein
MKKILYVILHGSVNKNRYFNVMDTWGKYVDCLFYSDHEDKEKNIIKVSDRKDYWGLEEKHINMFKILSAEYLNYDWYFFCDDDTFVNTKKMTEFLDECDTNCVYGCLINCYPNMKDLFYHSGGAGVLIHRKILDIVSKNINTKNTNFADVTLGIFLKENKITMKHDDRFHSEMPFSYGLKFNDAANNITFHHIKTKEEMVNLMNNV